MFRAFFFVFDVVRSSFFNSSFLSCLCSFIEVVRSVHSLSMNASDPMTMSGHEDDISACELEFFHEKAEVFELIASMCKDSVTEGEFDVLGESLSKRLLKYLEQSQLVRPHICDLLVPLNERLSITIDNYSLVSPQV